MDAQVDALLGQSDPEVVQMAIEHRLMHAETLAYLIHQLPFSQKCAPGVGDPRDTESRGPSRIDIPGGDVTLGRNREEGFGWDNEFSANRVAVTQSHAASERGSVLNARSACAVART